MRQKKGDELPELLLQQAKAASEDAIEAGGQISAEQLEALERLSRLAMISRDAQSLQSRKRWPLGIVLGLTLLIVSILLFARVSQTEIELDLAVSEAGFVLTRQQVLTDAVNVSALGLSGLQEIKLPPRLHDRFHRNNAASDNNGIAIRFAVGSESNRQGTVSLANLIFPTGTRVLLKHTEVPRQYRLSIAAQGLSLRANLNGPVHVAFAGMPAQQLNFFTPTAILLKGGADEVDIDIELPDGFEGGFAPSLSIRDLSLFRIDEYTTSHQTLVRRLSTVMSGTLYFESLNGREHRLRPGEMLHFEDAYGEIRTLRSHDDHFTLKFHGYVRGMRSGSSEGGRSLMPTYLEWLKARHGLSLFWGTTLYIFGMIAGVLRWWGVKS
jgi:hypothetical protein